MDSESRLSGFKSKLCFLPTVWPQANHLTSLSFTILTWVKGYQQCLLQKAGSIIQWLDAKLPQQPAQSNTQKTSWLYITSLLYRHMCIWSQCRTYLFQRVADKKCENQSFKLLYFGFFPTPAIKELWLIQKLIPGVGCVKWQTPKYEGGWVAESGVSSRAHDKADTRRWQC